MPHRCSCKPMFCIMAQLQNWSFRTSVSILYFSIFAKYTKLCGKVLDITNTLSTRNSATRQKGIVCQLFVMFMKKSVRRRSCISVLVIYHPIFFAGVNALCSGSSGALKGAVGHEHRPILTQMQTNKLIWVQIFNRFW